MAFGHGLACMKCLMQYVEKTTDSASFAGNSVRVSVLTHKTSCKLQDLRPHRHRSVKTAAIQRHQGNRAGNWLPFGPEKSSWS